MSHQTDETTNRFSLSTVQLFVLFRFPLIAVLKYKDNQMNPTHILKSSIKTVPKYS